MNIQNWGLGQIMQLPDYLFGRRFMVSCSLNLGVGATGWDISEVALPEMCVVWELQIVGTGVYDTTMLIRVALGDQLPANLAEMNRLEPLFMGLGFQGPEPRTLEVSELKRFNFNKLRMPVASQGKRLVMEGIARPATTGAATVGIVVSGVPKEIPDWLVSGNLRSR